MKRKILLSIAMALPTLGIAQEGLYSPRPLIVPIHTEAKQILLSGGYAFTNDYGSINVNSSYSLNSFLAILGAVTYNPFAYKGSLFLGGNYHYDFNNIGGSIGLEYFKLLKFGFVTEFQVGYGFTNYSRMSWTEYNANFNKRTEFNYSKIFTQASISKVFNNFDISFAVRITHANFGTYKEYLPYDGSTTETYKIPSQYYFEPSIAGSYKIKRVKINLQVGGFTKHYTTTETNISSTIKESVVFSRIGLQYSF